MKKIVKLMGLLLVAGAMFIGCKQEANTLTTDFKLSNGKWEFVADVTMSEEFLEDGVKITESMTYNTKEMLQVTDGAIKVLSATQKKEASVTFPEGTAQDVLDSAKALAEAKKGEGDTVTVKGTTVTLTTTHTATDAEIEEENADNPKVSDIVNSFPKGVEIYTNKKKTIYKVYYPVTSSSSDGLTASSKTTMTFTKQK